LKLQEEVNQNKEELMTSLLKEIKSSFNEQISNYTENNKKYFDEKWQNIDSEL
jgi:hypothetical protein